MLDASDKTKMRFVRLLNSSKVDMKFENIDHRTPFNYQRLDSLVLVEKSWLERL